MTVPICSETYSTISAVPFLVKSVSDNLPVCSLLSFIHLATEWNTNFVTSNTNMLISNGGPFKLLLSHYPWECALFFS